MKQQITPMMLLRKFEGHGSLTKEAEGSEESCPRRIVWASAVKAIGQELLKPLGTRVIPPLDLDTRHNASGFSVCFARFHLALVQTFPYSSSSPSFWSRNI